MFRTCALGLCLALASALPLEAHARTMTGLPQQKRVLVAGKSVVVRYLLYLPPSYRSDARKKWPLILFLHGSTEKGNNLDILKRNGLPAYLEKARSFPFVVISPQLSMDQERWDPLALKALLDSALLDLRVDRSRLYLTGWSLGGNGVWLMAAKYPDLFAAIAPVAGWGDASVAKLLKNVPVWAFHGAKDTNVLPQWSSSMVEALRRSGCKVRFTLYPDLDHDCWTVAYSNAGLYKWFLQHHRGKKAAASALRTQRPRTEKRMTIPRGK